MLPELPAETSTCLFYFVLLSGILIPSVIAILEGHLRNTYHLISEDGLPVAGPCSGDSHRSLSLRGVRGGQLWLSERYICPPFLGHSEQMSQLGRRTDVLWKGCDLHVPSPEVSFARQGPSCALRAAASQGHRPLRGAGRLGRPAPEAWPRLLAPLRGCGGVTLASLCLSVLCFNLSVNRTPLGVANRGE